MSKAIEWFKKSYVLILLALFYIPLLVAAIFSFSSAPKRAGMQPNFEYSNQGWKTLWSDIDIARDAFTSLVIGLTVSVIVVAISLMVVYALWRSKLKPAKLYVNATKNVPLINPDIITGVMLAITLTTLFGSLKYLDEGLERAIIGHVVLTMPYGITIMYPRSEIFNYKLIEASKDLGYGPLRTWFKTYLRHMSVVIIATFVITMAFSFDDFIVTKTTSKVETLGTKLYATTKLRPWIFALGTIIMGITISSSLIYTFVSRYKKKGVKLWKK